MRIAFVIKRPLRRADIAAWEIDDLLARGHEVRVFEVGGFVHPEIPAVAPLAVAEPGPSLQAVGSRAEFDAACDRLRDCDLIVPMILSPGQSPEVHHIMRRVSALGVAYLFVADVSIPGIATPRARATAPSRGLARRLAEMNLYRSVTARLPARWLGIADADVAYFNSLATADQCGLVGAGTRRVFGHTPDYGLYMRIRARDLPVADQAVFLDQYVSFHPDAYEHGVAGSLDTDAYYAGLGRLFQRVEDELGLEVVVAAHPRAGYADGETRFGGRRIVQNRTAELVATSKLVIAHVSTSVGFAVLWRRPVLLVANRQLLDYHKPHVGIYEGFAAQLGTRLHMFDDPDTVDLRRWDAVDTAAYGRYVDEYLRHPDADERPLWDAVLAAVGNGAGGAARLAS